MKLLKAYIFDLYNTLIYIDRPNNVSPYKKHFLELGFGQKELKSLRDLVMTTDLSYEELYDRVKEQYNKEIDIKALEEDIKDELSHAKVYDDVKACLEFQKVRGYKLGLVSNLATPYKEVITTFKLDEYFDYLALSCEQGLQKPQHEIYQKTLKELGVEADETIMIGDSLKNDYYTPKELGMDAYLLDREQKIQMLHELPDYHIAIHRELVEFI